MTNELVYNKARDIKQKIGTLTHSINRLTLDVKAMKRKVRGLRKELEPLEKGSRDWEKHLIVKALKKKGFLSKEREKAILEGK